MPCADSTAISPVKRIAADGASNWWVMLTVAVGSIATILPSGTFNIAVPDLMRDFDLGLGSVQLVITTFMITNTLAMLGTPWLIQRYGLRRCFFAAMSVLIVTSIVGSLSPVFSMLLTTRLLQGMTAAVLMPMGSIVVMQLFPPEQQGRALGIHALSITFALAIGPVIGGVLVDLWGWRAVALMPIPIGLLAWAAALRTLPRKDRSDPGRFDRVGMMWLVVLTLAWLAGFSRPAGIAGTLAQAWLPGCLVVVLVVLAFFIRHARQTPLPLLDGQLLRRPLLMAGGMVNFLLGFAMYGASYLLPVFLQEVLGMSASDAGVAQFPSILALSLAFPAAGILADRYVAHHLIVGGLALFAASFIALWFYADAVSYFGFIWITVLGRMGQSFALTPVSKVALAGLQGRLLNQAAMLLSYLTQLGGVLGVAGAAAFVSWRVVGIGEGARAMARAFSEGYLLMALVLALAAIVGTRMKVYRLVE